MKTNKLRGLYAITPAGEGDQATLVRDVESALKGGAHLVQYRDKSSDTAQRERTARALLAMAKLYNALLIINDDVLLAKTIAAHGVHLGQDDMPLQDARALLGPDAVIGVSCYNRFDLAQAAAQAGADYVAFGRFFPSRTKPGAAPAALDLLHRAKRELDTPVVAIGGITEDNAGTLVAAGADMVAVVEGLFGQAHIESSARQFHALFASRADERCNDGTNAHDLAGSAAGQG